MVNPFQYKTQLSLGTKTKDLTKFVHLSLRAIEDRKKDLRRFLV